MPSPLQPDAFQSNPGLQISRHPAAITLNLRTMPAPSEDDTREPLAAADPMLAASALPPAVPGPVPAPAPAMAGNQMPLADPTLAASQSIAAQPALAAAVAGAPSVTGKPPTASPGAIMAMPVAVNGTQAASVRFVTAATPPASAMAGAADTAPAPAAAVPGTPLAAAAANAPAQARSDAPPVSFKSMLAPASDGETGAAPATPLAATPVNPGLTAAVPNGAAPAAGADTIKLNGPAQQWQEPLREALGERLQTQIGRNSEHAVIRLDPPMLGRIDISIRHTAGTLQVNLSASNTEVLRQLQGIGENMRNDLAQRQYTEVAVTISATPRSPAAQTFAEGDARGQRQPGRQQDDAEPGRALSDDTPAGAPYGATFAMHEREYN